VGDSQAKHGVSARDKEGPRCSLSFEDDDIFHNAGKDEPERNPTNTKPIDWLK
jgi:hypothetical protein